MSFLSRLFGSRSGPKSTRGIDAQLERLEAEAERAAPGYVGTSYNKAGDLALKGGKPDRALKYYGRAIDAFLEDAQREAARGVANKIIRVRPSAVRTLCTLTWLDLAARHQATALLHLRDYVRAAQDAGQHPRAATQIFEMARLSPDPEFVDAVADALDGLDFPNRAEEVRGWAKHGAPGELHDADRLGDACLGAAIRSNERDQTLLADVESEAFDEADPVESAGDAAAARDEPGAGGEAIGEHEPTAEGGPAPEDGLDAADRPDAGEKPDGEDSPTAEDEPSDGDEPHAEDEPAGDEPTGEAVSTAVDEPAADDQSTEAGVAKVTADAVGDDEGPGPLESFASSTEPAQVGSGGGGGKNKKKKGKNKKTGRKKKKR